MKQTTLHPAGFLVSDGKEIAKTLQCVHCQMTWVVQPGSGRIRGFCARCNGPSCGPLCPAGQGCVPVDRFLQNKEEGKPNDFRPVVVNVPRLWLPDSAKVAHTP